MFERQTRLHAEVRRHHPGWRMCRAWSQFCDCCSGALAGGNGPGGPRTSFASRDLRADAADHSLAITDHDRERTWKSSTSRTRGIRRRLAGAGRSGQGAEDPRRRMGRNRTRRRWPLDGSHESIAPRLTSPNVGRDGSPAGRSQSAGPDRPCRREAVVVRSGQLAGQTPRSALDVIAEGHRGPARRPTAD